MRRSLLLLLLCTVLTGCPARPAPRPEAAPAPTPAAEIPPAPPQAPAPPPAAPAPPAVPQEPSDVMQAFMRALNAGEPEQVWMMLSSKTQQVMAPNEQVFGESLFFELREAYTGWKDPRVALNAVLDDDMAVAAIIGDRVSEGASYPDDVRALAMVKEGGQWRIALAVGPRISAAAPVPFGTVTADERRVAFYAPPPTRQTHLWVDGKELMPVPGEGGMIETLMPEGLKPGTHVTVALAATPDGQPAALGWSFRVK